MINFLLLISRHGKIRVSKWFTNYSSRDRTQMQREVKQLVIGRLSKLCNFLEWRDQILVFKRYASLYFAIGIDKEDNELIGLETIHFYVEVLDRYFGNVCELDIIFNFHKAYYLLDEIMLAGHQMESSKKQVHRSVLNQDTLMEEGKEETPKRRS